MGFFADHAADGEVQKWRLYYLGLGAPFATVSAPVAAGSQTVTPSSMVGVVPGALLSVIDMDAPALGYTVSAALAGAGAGSVNIGAHSYKIVVIKTGSLHTLPSGASAPILVTDNATNGRVNVTRSGAALPSGDTWDIYRTAAGENPVFPANFKLVNPTTLVASATIYSDNIADLALGTVAPTTSTTGGTNPEVVTVTATTGTTFTATFVHDHSANWLFNAAVPLYWTDCDLDIEWDGHTWTAQSIIPGPVSNQPDGASASFKIADGDGNLFGMFTRIGGGELALAAIYEAGFLGTNITPVPDDVLEIFSGLLDRAAVQSGSEDSIEIILMPSAQ